MAPKIAKASSVKKPQKTEKVVKYEVVKHATSFADPLEYTTVVDHELPFTQSEAIRFLEMKAFKGERPIRERHVQFLYDEFAAGRFLWQNIILASAQLNGDTYRINGQHTSWMRLNIKESIRPTIREMVYKVKDEEQLRALYSAFDRGAPRSVGHVGTVLMLGTSAGEGIKESYLAKCISGFRIYFSSDWNGKGRTGSVAEMTSMIEKNFSALFNKVGKFFTEHYGDNIWVRRAAILAAMFATFEKNEEKSYEFWNAVCTGFDLDSKDDQRWQLRRFIETHSHALTKGKDHVSQEVLFCTCINVWNHWRDGDKMNKVNPTAKRVKAK